MLRYLLLASLARLPGRRRPGLRGSCRASLRPFRQRRLPVYSLPVHLSVVLITHNEESNLGRTLESVRPLVRDGQGEVVVVDSGSTDRTLDIAKSFGAKIFVELWKGYAGQKNSAIEKASGDWILSLDADEELSRQLQEALAITLESLDRMDAVRRQRDAHPFIAEDAQAELENWVGVKGGQELCGIWIARKNEFLGQWIEHGGFWPDPKLRLFRRGRGRFEDRAVHETVVVNGPTGRLKQGAILHHCYPTLSDYIEHMNRYSSLGAEMVVADGRTGFSVINIAVRPLLTFVYNYFFRLGFLDGRKGLLLHIYHAVYVSWKYAKVWELVHVRKS
jgi:glycosyltransferase involved in cell wall biosynthesis